MLIVVFIWTLANDEISIVFILFCCWSLRLSLKNFPRIWDIIGKLERTQTFLPRVNCLHCWKHIWREILSWLEYFVSNSICHIAPSKPHTIKNLIYINLQKSLKSFSIAFFKFIELKTYKTKIYKISHRKTFHGKLQTARTFAFWWSLFVCSNDDVFNADNNAFNFITPQMCLSKAQQSQCLKIENLIFVDLVQVESVEQEKNTRSFGDNHKSTRNFTDIWSFSNFVTNLIATN